MAGQIAMWPPCELPVQNTFIHFKIFVGDVHAEQSGLRSCPPALWRVETDDALWTKANQELCHSMRVKVPDLPQKPTQASSTDMPSKCEPSNASAAPVAARAPPAGPSWVSVVKNHHKAPREEAKPAAAAPRVANPAVVGASRPDRRHEAGAAIASGAVSVVRSEVAGGRKGSGKGGLPHFQRIRVGIDDDGKFCVLRRILGPRGKHVKDIVAACPGSKVWVIGRGTRSWEDAHGPLTICIGAAKASSYEMALRSVNDLLRQTREEHARYIRSATSAAILSK